MRSAELPPGPRTPRAWQFARYSLDFVRFLEECEERYGTVFTLRHYPYDAFVVVTGVDDVQTVITDRRRFPGGGGTRVIEPLVGRNSVLIAAGAQHLRQRKLLLPSLHGEQVVRWRDRIEALWEEELDHLPVGEQLAMRPVMQRATFGIVCRLVFGFEDRRRIEEFSAAVEAMLDPKLMAALFFPKLERLGRLNPARSFVERRAAVHRLVLAEIGRQRSEAEHAERDHVLAVLMRTRDEDGNGLTDLELRDELMGMLIAGHGSTATTLTWVCERLSRHPKVQRRLAAELLGGTERTYLDAVIKETLRSKTSVIDAVRTAAEDTELGGHPIPKGTTVAAMFCITHRSPRVWDEPLAFRPDRFLGSTRDPDGYFPWGGGVRRCVGATFATFEMRVMVEALVRRFVIEAAPGKEETQRLAGVFLIPSRGGRVVLQPRKEPTPSVRELAGASRA